MILQRRATRTIRHRTRALPDIETFEQLNGKVIQPDDDEPSLGDEVELKDIET